MSLMYKLFQDYYPKLAISQLIISMSDGARADLKVILNKLNFFNSQWIFYGVNVEIINCHAAFLSLELKNLTHAIIQNCIFGNWKFIKVQNAFIKNCNIVFHEDFSKSLNFLNSSVYIENITMTDENIIGDLNGIYLSNYSLLYVEHSKFVNNTVKQGIFKILKSSSLIMSNCTVLENHATDYPGVIIADESFVHLKNMSFNGNMASNGGGAISIQNFSFLQIRNCTFKNNTVDRTFGAGGAISCLNSSLDISYSIFDYNKALLGGAIHQETSKTKLNQCSFFGNSETAITGFFGSEMSIMNSIFQNNLAKHAGGAVSMAEKCVLNVSNTTFKNNVQRSASIYIMTYEEGGGGAIFLSKSVANISKSTFENNVAVALGGAIRIDSCSMIIEDSTFKNNSVAHKVMGAGGGLFLFDNSTLKISNVLFSKCHAKFGGAIASNFTTIIMSNSSVISNTGSAIYLNAGDTFEMNNCTFSNNSTPESGGAILCNGYCTVKMVNTKFDQNSAVKDGGAVYVSIANMFVKSHRMMSNLIAHNCSFTYNTAYQGGAMILSDAVFNIVDSNFSGNIATEGIVAITTLNGNLIMKNCCISNNTVFQDGGFIQAFNGTLHISDCLVFNNTAYGNGGVVKSLGSGITITTSILMNRALGSGGVFYVVGGTMILRNSWFAKNVVTISGGVLTALDKADINITESFCFENEAKYSGSVLFTMSHVKIIMRDTNISHNSGYLHGAMYVIENSILKIYRSQIEGNSAEEKSGVLAIADSLFVGLNSTFKGNSAYLDNSISIANSTVYLEKCNFIENQLTYGGGTISTYPGSMLKLSNTFFTRNEGHDIFYYVENNNFVTKFETYRCLFVAGNISLKSSVKNFEEVAVEEKVIGQLPFLNQSFFKPGETPYASSKMFPH